MPGSLRALSLTCRASSTATTTGTFTRHSDISAPTASRRNSTASRSNPPHETVRPQGPTPIGGQTSKPIDSVPGGPFDDSDKARYVFEFMGFDDDKYERKKEKTHRRMERLGQVIPLEGWTFESAHYGLERQLERIAFRLPPARGAPHARASIALMRARARHGRRSSARKPERELSGRDAASTWRDRSMTQLVYAGIGSRATPSPPPRCRPAASARSRLRPASRAS